VLRARLAPRIRVIWFANPLSMTKKRFAPCVRLALPADYNCNAPLGF